MASRLAARDADGYRTRRSPGITIQKLAGIGLKLPSRLLRVQMVAWPWPDPGSMTGWLHRKACRDMLLKKRKKVHIKRKINQVKTSLLLWKGRIS